MICPSPPIIFFIAAFLLHFIHFTVLSVPSWKRLLLLRKAEAAEVCLFLVWPI